MVLDGTRIRAKWQKELASLVSEIWENAVSISRHHFLSYVFNNCCPSSCSLHGTGSEARATSHNHCIFSSVSLGLDVLLAYAVHVSALLRLSFCPNGLSNITWVHVSCTGRIFSSFIITAFLIRASVVQPLTDYTKS
jgi:hypothetical protein